MALDSRGTDREDIQITEADVNADIKSLKIGKTPGEDDIRPDMLKAMNKYVRWLTRVSKVTCRTGQAMVNQCDNTHPQERRPEKMHQL